MPSYEDRGDGTSARGRFRTAAGMTYKRQRELAVSNKAALEAPKGRIVLSGNADSGVNRLSLF